MKKYAVRENKILKGFWDVYDTETGKSLFYYTGLLSRSEAEYNAEVLNREVIAGALMRR